MDFADFHFATTWLALAAPAAGAALFAGLRWTELRRRRGLATFAAERLLALRIGLKLDLGKGAAGLFGPTLGAVEGPFVERLVEFAAKIEN